MGTGPNFALARFTGTGERSLVVQFKNSAEFQARVNAIVQQGCSS